MNRFKKYLATAALLALPILAACGEDPIIPPATGSITGQVSIEGMGADGVSVNLSNGASTTTAGGGNYRFDGVVAGAYTVTISGFPADASFDATSASVTIPENGGSVTHNFQGSYIRTASVMGTVTVEGAGLGGVTVRLSGMADAQTATDMSGQYAFTGLRAGTYAVEISGFDGDEVAFGATSSGATVGVGESKIVSFDGTYLRTAGISGRVTVEGDGLPGVTVSLSGVEQRTMTTDAGGQYAFAKLKAGDYSVAISDYDTDAYAFEQTSKSVTIATGEPATVPFDGTLLRTSGISGRVSAEGEGLDGVTVTLAGAAEATQTTKDGGQYAFAGLAEGTYVVTISGWDEVAYNFENTTATIVLGDSDSPITNFEGTHTRTAGISGMLFIDEVVQDKMHTEGEPTLPAALAPLVASGALDPVMFAGLLAQARVLFRGPDLNDTMSVAIQADGTFASPGLVAGTYQVSLPVSDEAAMALAAAGVESVGEAAVVTLGAGMKAPVNFPFRITMQTINVGAVLAMADEENSEIPAERPRVEDVKIALYATAQDAEDRANALMEGTTGEDGMATFDFARMADSGPGGTDTDNLVFVRLAEEDGTDEDLQPTANEVMEIQYRGIERITQAPNTVRFVNVAVNFDFWVKNIEMARGGNMGLGGWAVQYCAPMDDDPETEEKDAVVCEGKDAGFMAITTGGGEDEEPEPVLSDTTTAMDNMNLGKVSFSYTLMPEMLAEGPVPFRVRVTPVAVDGDGTRTDVQKGVAKGEMWEDSGVLTREHTGLDLPPGEDDDPIDLGPIRIEFTTQSLTVGVYRETDDHPGFTDHRSDYRGGDHRPHTDAIEVELMYSEGGGRLERYDEYMTFDAKGKRTVEADNPMDVPKWSVKNQAGGMVTFKHLPADMDFTVRLRAGSGRTAATARDVDAFGGDLDDMTDGSFGGAGGALPVVRLCPLTTTSRPDFLGPESDDCATFAYQWTTGTVHTTLTKLRKDVKATLTLDPVTAVHSEGADKDFKGNATGDDQTYTFAGVQDGVYRVVLTGGDVKETKSDELEIYHDESAADPDDAPDTDAWTVSATSVRGMIKGVVANNRIGNSDYTISGDEAGEGVELGLYEVGAGKDKEKGTADDVPGDPVEDDDDNAVTAPTDENGEYVFDNLAEGDEYFVKVLECEGCVAYHSVDDDDHSFVAYGKGAAMVYPADVKNMLPEWNYSATAITSIISNQTDGGFLDFVMLYTDGTLAGEVSEPFDEVDDHDIELARCLTVVGDPATACAEYDDNFEDEVETDDDGQWSIGDLREGAYEVTVNPKGGFRIYDAAKDVLADGSSTELVEYATVKTDFFMLEDGSGASDEAPTVEIVNSRLSRSVLLGDIAVTAGEITITGAPGAIVIPTQEYIVKTITVAPVSADGERFNVANGTATVTPKASDIGNAPKTKFTVTLADGGNAITLTATAANGYTKGVTRDTADPPQLAVTAGSTSAVAVTTVTRTAVQTAAAIASVAGNYRDNTGALGTEDPIGSGTGGIDYEWGDGTNGGDGLPHDAQSKFSLTFSLGTGSDWATLGYRIGDTGVYTDIPMASDATDAAGRAARTTGMITGPDKGASVDIQVKVVSQDGKTPIYYAIRVWRDAAP